ncbi:endonuclease domain-containing protein [Streptomyces sp. NPDC006872]|uniref:endonuclease domain-containing protein n=1 Tax=Streptomyces sp. NPDC006872 TaxID=3155720 RepID=UPI0033CCEF4F
MLLLEWHNRRCAICGRLVSNRGVNRIDRLLTDHDHATGLVRGLLCKGCNTTEGRLLIRSLRYVGYRQRHPTKILGLTIPYRSTWMRSGAAHDGAETLSTRHRTAVAALLEAQQSGGTVPTEVLEEIVDVSATAIRMLRARGA